MCKGRWIAKQDGGIVKKNHFNNNNPSPAPQELPLHKGALVGTQPFRQIKLLDKSNGSTNQNLKHTKRLHNKYFLGKFFGARHFLSRKGRTRPRIPRVLKETRSLSFCVFLTLYGERNRTLPPRLSSFAPQVPPYRQEALYSAPERVRVRQRRPHPQQA